MIFFGFSEITGQNTQIPNKIKYSDINDNLKIYIYIQELIELI